MTTYVVTQVTEDLARGTTVETFGPFSDHDSADRYRRQLLARNVDRYPHPSQRPKITVSQIMLAEATR